MAAISGLSREEIHELLNGGIRLIRPFDLGWRLGGRATFPREELYGLTSQLRRCSASIHANLAHAELSQRATELKRMLTALLHYAECRTMPNRFP